MKFLRPLVGVSRRDHLHNEVIREQLGETYTVKDIQKYGLQQTNHLERAENDFLKEHFIINPEIERKFKDQKKDAPTSFESWNRHRWLYP
jgi:hypothetical protein